MTRELSGYQRLKIANEISIDVVGVILVLGKRSIGIHLSDTDAAQLPGKDLKVFH